MRPGHVNPCTALPEPPLGRKVRSLGSLTRSRSLLRSNTLTFNNDNVDNSNRGACDQDPGMTGRTAITLFKGSDTVQSNENHDDATATSSSPAYAIVDLTAAYGPQNSSRVERGFAFTKSYGHLLIVDEFDFPASSSVRNVTWTMHTMATVNILEATGGARPAAVLSLGGVRLHATVIEPEKGVAFSTASVDLLPPAKPSAGVSKLQVHLPVAPGGVMRIVVGLSLSAAAATVKPTPLAEWKTGRGPFAAVARRGAR